MLSLFYIIVIFNYIMYFNVKLLNNRISCLFMLFYHFRYYLSKNKNIKNLKDCFINKNRSTLK